MFATKKKLIYVSLMALGLVACGGGDGGDSEPAAQSSTKTITGVITGFGSIFIDGVEYDTGSADFDIDGVAGSEDDLEVGMVVTLTGTVDENGVTGVASAVHFSAEIEGLIFENNYLADGSLNVMGQRVVINDDTTLESEVDGVSTFEQLEENNFVEVSGFSSQRGEIYATHIELKSQERDERELEVKGRIENLDQGAMTFTLGDLLVDYSQASLNMSDIANEMFVEVESDQGLSEGVLLASSIEREDDDSDDEDDDHDDDHDDHDDDAEEVEFEGVVMSTDDDSLVINGYIAHYDDETEFENGSLDDLGEGIKIKVEGELDENGELILDEVKFYSEDELELEGRLEAVDADAKTVTMMGKVFYLNNMTAMRDDQDDDGATPVRYFDVSDLSVGDWVEIEAYFDDVNERYVATKLEREDDDGDEDWEIEGSIEQDFSMSGWISISGISVDVANISDVSMDVGSKVEISGVYSNGVFHADEIELEDD